MLIKLESEYFGGAVKVIAFNHFDDNRGFFSVPYREDEFRALGLPTNFVQDNHSRSRANVVRGLHFQLDPPMGKLMRVTRGCAQLVAVDIRRDSPTFLQHHSVYLDEYSNLLVWAEAGFARGFAAYEDNTEVQYKCTGMFDADADSTIAWNDPNINIDWGLRGAIPILSEKDLAAPTAAEYFGDI